MLLWPPSWPPAARCSLLRSEASQRDTEQDAEECWLFVVCSGWSENLLRRPSLCSAESSSVSAAGKHTERHSELPSKPSGLRLPLVWAGGGNVSPPEDTSVHRRTRLIQHTVNDITEVSGDQLCFLPRLPVNPDCPGGCESPWQPVWRLRGRTSRPSERHKETFLVSSFSSKDSVNYNNDLLWENI